MGTSRTFYGTDSLSFTSTVLTISLLALMSIGGACAQNADFSVTVLLLHAFGLKDGAFGVPSIFDDLFDPGIRSKDFSISFSDRDIPLDFSVQFNVSYLSSRRAYCFCEWSVSSEQRVPPRKMHTQKDFPESQTFVFNKTGLHEVTFRCSDKGLGVRVDVTMRRRITVYDWDINDIDLDYTYQEMNGNVPDRAFPFSLKLDPFQDAPPLLTANITYGDGTPPVVFTVTSLTLPGHLYPRRAVYQGSVRLEHPDKGEKIIPFDARVGFCQISVTPLRGLMGTVDYALHIKYPVSLTDANAQLAWNDGTGESFSPVTDYVYTHNYASSGKFNPSLSFRSKIPLISETIAAVLPSPILVERVMDGTLQLTLNRDVVLVPPGNITAFITHAGEANPFLDLECSVDFDDALDPIPRHKQGYLAPGASFEVPFTFYILGSHDVKANCSTNYTQVLLSAYVFVHNPCFSNDSLFDKQYRVYNPITVPNSQDWLLVSRNIIYCPRPSFWWSVQEVTPEGLQTRNVTLARQPFVDFLTLERGWLDPGLYVMKVNISFGKEQKYTWLVCGVYVKVIRTPPVAAIQGGRFRTTNDPRTMVDGYSLSHDPALSVDDKTGLQFIWRCFTYNSSSLDELTEKASRRLPANDTSNCDDISIEIRPGYRQLRVGTDVEDAGYLFKVTVQKGAFVSRPARQYLQYSTTTIPIGITCLVNCELKMAVTSHLLLSVMCESCSDADLMQASYGWSLSLYDNVNGRFEPLPSSEQFFSPPSDEFSSPSGTDKGPMVSIKENSLLPCVRYRVVLQMTTLSGLVGAAARDMFTNCPPWGGNCSVYPPFGDGVNSTFQMWCTGWRDDGLKIRDDDDEEDDGSYDKHEDMFSKMLYYKYLLRKNGITVPIAETAQSVMPRMEMPMIPGQGGGNYDLIVRIYDVLDDYTEVVNIIYLDLFRLDEETSVNGTKVTYWQDQLKYSERDSTLDKQLRAVSTVSGLIDFIPIPDVRNPLEIAVENKSEVAIKDEDWRRLWSDLNEPSVNPTREEITGLIKSISSQVYHRGKDCTYLTGQGVAALGEGMAAALNNPETVDEESAVQVSEAAEKGTQSLVKLYHKQPFPVGAKLDEAVFSMTSLIDKILAASTPTYDLSVGNDLLFNSDVGPDESTLVVSKLRQFYGAKEKLKIKAGRRAVPKLSRAVYAMLDTLLKGVVLGQGPRHVRRGRVELSVRKLIGRSLFNAKVNAASGVDLQLDLADDEDGESSANPDDALDVKTTVYDKNPYSWASDGSSYEITSPVVTVDAMDSHGRNKTLRKITVSIRRGDGNSNNAVPIVHPFSSNDTQDGPDGWLYHRMTLRSGSSAVVTRFQLPESFTKVTAYFRSGRPPTHEWHDYRTDGQVVSTHSRQRRDVNSTSTQSEMRQFFVPPGSLSPGVVFVGFHLPELGVQADVQYGYSSFSDMCKVWNPETETWDGTSCELSAFSSPEETICHCNKPPGRTFASSFFVAPNTIDWNLVFLKFDPSNASVYGTLIGLFCLWMLALVWARPRDRRDRQTWMVKYLSDNCITDRYFYMLTVYTGLRKGAGTKSNVRFIVAGENGQTRVRHLSDGERELSRGSVLTFIMTSERDLGQLRCVRLWHDDSALGDQSSWYLSRVVVEDLHKGHIYNFICERWFAMDKEDGQIDRIVPAIQRAEDMSFYKLFQERTRLEVTDSHIWLSCFLRPQRSSFTRMQRVTCCFALLLLTMISSAMFFQPEDQETGESKNNMGMEVRVGPLRFSLTTVWTSIVSVGLSTVPVFVFIVLFRSCRPRPGSRVTTGDEPNAENLSRVRKEDGQKEDHSEKDAAKEKSTDDKLIDAKGDESKKTGKPVGIGSAESEAPEENSLAANRNCGRSGGKGEHHEDGATIVKRTEGKHTDPTDELSKAAKETDIESGESEEPGEKHAPANDCSDESGGKVGHPDGAAVEKSADEEHADGKDGELTRTATPARTENVQLEVSEETHIPANASYGDNEGENRHAEGAAAKESTNSERTDVKEDLSNKAAEDTGTENGELGASGENHNPTDDSQDDDNEARLREQAEEAARYLCDVLQSVLQQNPLPHWSLYITWCALLTTMAACAFFLVLYSMQWGPTVSEEWLASFFLSFFQSVFLMDPVKVLLLACMLAYCAPNPLTATQHQHVDMNRVEREVQTLASDHADTSAEPPEPISEEVLQESRKRHHQERLAQKVFAELVLYLIFVFCIFCITYGNRDIKTNWTNTHIDNLLYSASGSAPFPFESITSRNDVIRYVNETLRKSVFPWTDMLDRELPWQQRQFASDGVSFRLGPVRLRQVRQHGVTSTEIIRRYPTLRSSEEIHPAYSEENEDRSGYCLGWNGRPPCPEEHAIDKYSASAWTYSEASTHLPVWGIYHYYGSGGYAADLSTNRDVVGKIIEELHQERWLDLHTRAVFVEACFYNPNTNLFTFLRLGVEFPEVGASVTWRDLQTLRLYKSLDATGVFVFICELLALVFVVVFTVRIALKAKEQKCDFFKDVWQVLDMVALLWIYVAVVLYVMKILSVDDVMSKWRYDPKAYVDFYAAVIWDAVYGYVLAALCFAVTVRLLRVLGYNRRLTMLATVLEHSCRDLLGYSFMFFLVITAYASAGHLLYVTQLEQFRSPLTAYSWLYNMLLGKNRLGAEIRKASLWAEVYFLSLAVLVVFILYTMFQVILTNATVVIRSHVQRIPPPYGVTNVVTQMYRTFADLLPVGSLFRKAAVASSDSNNGKDGDAASGEVKGDSDSAMMWATKVLTSHRPDDKPYSFQLRGPPSAVKFCVDSEDDVDAAGDGDKTPPTTVSAFISDEFMIELEKISGVMKHFLKEEKEENIHREGHSRWKERLAVVRYRDRKRIETSDV